MAEQMTPDETLVAYYAHSNMSRVEKQVVAYYDGRPLVAAPFAPFEKLVEVTEKLRVKLVQSFRVPGDAPPGDNEWEFNKMQVIDGDKVLCDVKTGDWVQTPGATFSRLFFKAWFATDYGDTILLVLFNGTNFDLERLFVTKALCQVPKQCKRCQFDMKKLKGATQKLRVSMDFKIAKACGNLPIDKIVAHRDTTKVLDDKVDWYYSVHYRGYSDAIVEEINEEDALWRCSKLVRKYRKELKASAAAAAAEVKLQDMRGGKKNTKPGQKWSRADTARVREVGLQLRGTAAGESGFKKLARELNRTPSACYNKWMKIQTPQKKCARAERAQSLDMATSSSEEESDEERSNPRRSGKPNGERKKGGGTAAGSGREQKLEADIVQLKIQVATLIAENKLLRELNGVGKKRQRSRSRSRDRSRSRSRRRHRDSRHHRRRHRSRSRSYSHSFSHS